MLHWVAVSGPLFVLVCAPSVSTRFPTCEALLESTWKKRRGTPDMLPDGSSDEGGAFPHSKRVEMEDVSGKSAPWAMTLLSMASEVAAMANMAARRLLAELAEVVMLLRLNADSTSIRS